MKRALTSVAMFSNLRRDDRDDGDDDERGCKGRME